MGKQVKERKPRPSYVEGSTYKIKTGCQSLYVSVNHDEEGMCELFAKMGKSGGCYNAQVNALARVISVGLQHGVPPEAYVETLKGISCPSPGLYKGERISSCADAIAVAILTDLEREAK